MMIILTKTIIIMTTIITNNYLDDKESLNGDHNLDDVLNHDYGNDN